MADPKTWNPANRAAHPIRVLIVCERSGAVRRAFQALGHEAYSCDLEPCDDGDDQHHIQADARMVLYYPARVLGGMPRWMIEGRWDLVIGHPVCTYLCNSGVRWFTTPAKNPEILTGEARRAAMDQAAEFFARIYHCGAPCVALENPVQHRHARAALAAWGVPTFTQSIQPWQFGDPYFKRTCLWLRGLPKLEIDPDEVLRPPKAGEVGHKEWSMVHRASPGKDRARLRSVTFDGIAREMARQWGGFVAARVAEEEG